MLLHIDIEGEMFTWLQIFLRGQFLVPLLEVVDADTKTLGDPGQRIAVAYGVTDAAGSRILEGMYKVGGVDG